MNGGQIQSTFAQPRITFMAFFRIAWYNYYFIFSSSKGRRDNNMA